MSTHGSTATAAIACLLFFVSGALGLGYQLVWVQKAALVVGSSQIALATVLTSFFLGLGLGSLVVGRRLRSSRRSPLEIYGWFELAIGLFALAFPLLFHGVEAVYAGLFPAFAQLPVGLFLLRFSLLFALFIVPTFFMGGTLPLLARRIEPLRVLALQPLVPVATLLCLDAWTLARLDLQVLDHYAVRPSWALLSEAADAVFTAPALQTALVLFLPVVVIGTGLPSLIAAASRRRDALRTAAGSLVFWNTLGSSAGGFFTGYALIPALGLGGTLGMLALLSVGLGIGAEWTRLRPLAPAERAGDAARSRRPGTAVVALLVIAALASTAVLVNRDLVPDAIREYTTGAGLEGDELIAVEEGPLATAYVFDGPRIRSIGAGNVRLAFAAHEEASPQAFQGHLPAIFHPSPEGPKTALGIALGSGQSFGALLRHPIERLDVVEISPAVRDLALEHFEPFINGLGDDPRVRFHMDDGRHFVARTADATYDVVSMEPPPPTHAGVYGLYSLEFYREVRRVLRPGGVFMQWLPPYLITPADLRGMLRTLHEVFPQTLVVKSGERDFMALSFAQDTAPRWELATLEARVGVLQQEPFLLGAPWRGGMRWPAASLYGVIALLVTGPADVAGIDGVLHREDDQRLSYSSGDRVLLRRYMGGKLMRVTTAALPVTPFSELAGMFAQPIPVDALDEERARSLARFGIVSPGVLRDAESAFAEETNPKLQAERAISLAEMHHRRLALEPALRWLEAALLARPDESRPHLLETVRTIAGRESGVYAETFRAWVEALPADLRAAPITATVSEAVREQDERDARLRERYLFD